MCLCCWGICSNGICLIRWTFTRSSKVGIRQEFWWVRIGFDIPFPSTFLNIYSIGRSPSSWTDNEICQEWLKQKFMTFTCSLILDSHESHENWELQCKIYAFSDCEVVVFCFPSKTTHKLQPLDVVVFSPVGRKWQEHCDMILHKGILITRYNVIPEYLKV